MIRARGTFSTASSRNLRGWKASLDHDVCHWSFCAFMLTAAVLKPVLLTFAGRIISLPCCASSTQVGPPLGEPVPLEALRGRLHDEPKLELGSVGSASVAVRELSIGSLGDFVSALAAQVSPKLPKPVLGEYARAGGSD